MLRSIHKICSTYKDSVIHYTQPWIESVTSDNQSFRIHKRNREWAKSQNKKSVTNMTSDLIYLLDYQHNSNKKPYRSRARKRARSGTKFLRLPLLIGLKLVVNLLPAHSLGLMRLLEAVPHHGCTGVNIRDVCHSHIFPVHSRNIKQNDPKPAHWNTQSKFFQQQKILWAWNRKTTNPYPLEEITTIWICI